MTYALDNVVAESKGWVLDKGAGETILLRAAKMGYPDVVAYALDIMRVNPTLKDNAGIPPIHRAAYKGHAEIVDMLLRYGVDPNTNVKGTRPLHEALIGGSTRAVCNLLSHGSDPLLYDYTGHMPSDLAEEDEDMKRYFGCLLADLHGRDSERYSVAHDEAFIRPRDDELPSGAKAAAATAAGSPPGDESVDDLLDDFVFECSAQPLPPFFQFLDREGHFLKVADLRAFLHGRLDMKRLETIVDMTREDFLRTAHCCLLGHKKAKAELKHDVATNIVQLVQVDDGVRKMLGMDSVGVEGGRRSPTPPPPQPPPPPPHRPPIRPRILAAALASPSKSRRKQL